MNAKNINNNFTFEFLTEKFTLCSTSRVIIAPIAPGLVHLLQGVEKYSNQPSQIGIGFHILYSPFINAKCMKSVSSAC